MASRMQVCSASLNIAATTSLPVVPGGISGMVNVAPAGVSAVAVAVGSGIGVGATVGTGIGVGATVGTGIGVGATVGAGVDSTVVVSSESPHAIAIRITKAKRTVSVARRVFIASLSTSVIQLEVSSAFGTPYTTPEQGQMYRALAWS